MRSTGRLGGSGDARLFVALALAVNCLAGPVRAEGKLAVTVEGVGADRTLPLSAAFCAPPSIAPRQYNISPAMSWSGAPQGVKSYVVLMTDLDVPTDLSLINKPGVVIPMEFPRQPFIHQVLIDIPPGRTYLAKGVESHGFVAGPRPIGKTDHGVRGANVYSNLHPKDSPLAGPRGGYDGPCPPHNDPKPHRYLFSVYALDVDTLGLEGLFFGEAVLERMKGHKLAEGHVETLYGGLSQGGLGRDLRVNPTEF